ncbi:MAG: AAA family ATPase [Sphingobacteriales bacterium]|nr:AAA family ATPase [Sphingobacteriales bacterium]
MQTFQIHVSTIAPKPVKINGFDKISPDIISEEIDRLTSECALTKYADYRVTAEKNIDQPDPVILMGVASVASPGNLTAISAAAKTGKTAVSAVFLAGAIRQSEAWDGFGPDLTVKTNLDNHAVICFDTEQSEADQQYKVKTVLRRAGLDATPGHYLEYNIRSLSITDYQKVTDEICQAAFKKFGGIHLIMIDGGADYILSVNDESAATLIVQYFIHLAIRFKCPVIVIVHQNPGSGKERGHFGSEIQRKCYGLLEITKSGDISTLAPKMLRKAGNGDVPNISFRYCKIAGYHVPVDPPDTEQIRAENERKRHEVIAKAVFGPGIALTYADAVSAIMKETSRQERTAKSMIKNMIGWELIKKGEDGRHRIFI